MDKIISTRDTGANSSRGRAAHLLARLDQMFFEGSTTLEQENLREQLYTTLWQSLHNEYVLDKDNWPSVDGIDKLLDSADARKTLVAGDDGEQPWLGRAKRLLSVPKEKTGLYRRSVPKVQDLDTKWDTFVAVLKTLVQNEDELGIHAYSLGSPWLELHTAAAGRRAAEHRAG